MNYFFTRLILISSLLITLQHVINAQLDRIKFNNRDLFFNGSNIAWVNFASDIGPGSTNFKRFGEIFAEVHADGGNALRFWLHTDGTRTPEFNGDGIVIGPGQGAVSDLKQILDSAWAHNVGLLLSLWSHDMLRTSLSAAILERNRKLLTDTSAIHAYINNALIPLVEGVKGHPAIIAWEIFNEPEGFTEIGSWGDRIHVTEYDVQRFVNLTAGAIHRTDPAAKVTNGTWNLSALTNVSSISKKAPGAFYNSLSVDEKKRMEKEFQTKFDLHLSAKEIIDRYANTAANYNYYQDDRLITAGGDPDGTLDFYTVHYYSGFGPGLSPFNHPYSAWDLSKPLVIAEFYMEDTYGIPYQNLYTQLFNTGYAGAMSWQWWGDTQANDNAKNWNHERTASAIKNLFLNHPHDIVVNPVSGTIYSFNIIPSAIEAGDSALIKWDTEDSLNASLNGENIPMIGSKFVNPPASTSYKLTTSGQISDTAVLNLSVLPAGTIVSFKAFPTKIGIGESSLLKWHTVRGSLVTLNGETVSATDTMTVYPDSGYNNYSLVSNGEVHDSTRVTVEALPAGSVDRAQGGTVTVSSNDTITTPSSKPGSINDGDNLTKWQALKGKGQWILFDLGKTFSINKIIIRWAGNGFASRYTIQSTVDSSKWNLLEQIVYGTGGINNVETFDNVQGIGRYIVFLLQLPGKDAVSVNEIEIYGTPVTVDTNDRNKPPFEYSLSQNFPNPFNPATQIRFTIPVASDVKLEIFNLLGQKIAALINKKLSAGNYSVNFDASNLSSGIYFYSLRAGNYIKTKKMVHLK